MWLGSHKVEVLLDLGGVEQREQLVGDFVHPRSLGLSPRWPAEEVAVSSRVGCGDGPALPQRMNTKGRDDERETD